MNQQSLVPLKASRDSQAGLARLQRKCACEESGATCARCTNKKSGLQRKLAIGASNDPLEQEADRVADQVMAAPGHSAVSAIPPRIQRYVGRATEGTDSAPASVDHVIARSGRPLDPTLRRDMEQRFGHNFSQVRVHSGADAEQSVRDINANAYTVGNNIVFGTGRFAPSSHEGRRLIAHELAHVVQQSGADGIRADLGNVKLGLSPFPLQQQVAAGRPILVLRAPEDGKPSPPVVSLPSKSENQSRLAELMADWVPSPEKQRNTTISRAAAIELKTGRRVYLVAIAGEGAALPLDQSLLRPDEVSVPYTGGHAEIQTMHFAAKEGYKILPGALEPSRAFCTNCAFWARHGGLTPPDAKVRVGQHEKPLAEVPDSELAKNAGSKRIPNWRGELTEKGKAKQKAKQSKTPTTQVRIAEQNAAKPSVAKGVAVNGDEPRVRVGEQSLAANPSSPQVKQSIVDGRVVNTEDIIGVIGKEESPTSGNLEQAKPTAKKYLNMPETRTQPPPTTGSSPITAKPTPQVGTPAQPALKPATAASPGGSPTTAASAATAGISSSGSSSAKTPSNAVTPASTPAAKGTTATPAQPAAPQPSSPVGTAGTGTAAAKAPVDAAPPRLTGTQGQRVYGGAQPASKALAPTQAQQQHADAVQQRAANAAVMLELTRARLEDISDDDERDQAEIWLVQNRPVIYQALFEHPGAAMVVQFHFERVNGRLKYRGATTEMMSDGKPPQGVKEDSADIAGTGVKLFFPPVRKAPQAPVKQEASQPPAPAKLRLVQSAEELIGLLPNNANNLASYYALQDAHGSGVMGPFRMRLGATEFEVTATALDQAMQVYRVRLESSLGERHQRLKDDIARSQKDLDAALTTHGNFATKWWYRKRIALLDPHVLDKPREHEAAARDAITRGDFRAAAASLRAGEELVTLADERIHQFHEGVDRIEEQEI
ncbi:eCIS core domain-containing protein [Methylobacter marinus]|uniref:eCIS core domain-containing protein n=1 Tax=Methylobacter marinus TaxID=34058 RepID=UPI0003794D8A|nr:DUF4157 domain-containing protein [Methylobacter marinus]